MKLKDFGSKKSRLTETHGFLLPICIGLLVFGTQVEADIDKSCLASNLGVKFSITSAAMQCNTSPEVFVIA